jgi:hypothetical protein
MTRTENRSQGNLVLQLICLALVAILPFFGALLLYLFTPGFIVPFLNNDIVRIILLALLLWECLGLIVLFRANDWKTWWLFSIIFTQPILVTLMIGPYVVMLVNFFGPLMSGAPSSISAADWQKVMISVATHLTNHVVIRIQCLSVFVFMIGVMASYPGVSLRLFRLDRNQPAYK